ncbi:hypothetical protein Tco_0789438 [Tanacetum coccineum]
MGEKNLCLVTGLGVGSVWAEYDTKQRIPFRRRVFPSYLDGKPITGIDIANTILDQSFAQLYDDDVVGLCCLGILQLVILGVESKRVVPDWMLRLANDRVAWTISLGFLCSGQHEYYNLECNLQTLVDLDGDEPTVKLMIKNVFNLWILLGHSMPAQSATQYWQPDTSSQPGSYYSFGRVPSHMGRQNLQTTIETHDDVDGIFNQHCVRTRQYLSMGDFGTDNQEKDEKQSQNDKTGLGMEKL